jgi:uncharacterized membrane protein
VKQIMALVVALIGVAIMVMGILFMMQANTGKQQVADEITPVTLSNLNATYDKVKTGYDQYAALEGAKVQAGQAHPSVEYDYYSAQRALLGIAKSNIAMSGFVLMSGVVEIVLGFGLVLAGLVLYMKPAAVPAAAPAAKPTV